MKLLLLPLFPILWLGAVLVALSMFAVYAVAIVVGIVLCICLAPFSLIFAERGREMGCVR